MNKSALLNMVPCLKDPFADPNPIPSFVTHEPVWGWHGDAPIFDELVSDTKAGIVIEVGSWLGQSAISLASALKRERPGDSVLICIDTWLGSFEHWIDEGLRPQLQFYKGYPTLYWRFLYNIAQAGLAEYVQPLPLTSAASARLLGHFNIRGDLIYIDGSHDEEDVARDLQEYWNILNNGGVLFGDDYDFLSVASAIDKFVSKRNLCFEIQTPFWIIRKE